MKKRLNSKRTITAKTGSNPRQTILVGKYIVQRKLIVVTLLVALVLLGLDRLSNFKEQVKINLVTSSTKSLRDTVITKQSNQGKLNAIANGTSTQNPVNPNKNNTGNNTGSSTKDNDEVKWGNLHGGALDQDSKNKSVGTELDNSNNFGTSPNTTQGKLNAIANGTSTQNPVNPNNANTTQGKLNAIANGTSTQNPVNPNNANTTQGKLNAIANGTSTQNPVNPNNATFGSVCKAGNVSVYAGTWVATGFNMGEGKENERQCVQIEGDCSHGQKRACHEVYAETPTEVVLPSSGGPEYSQGLTVSSRGYQPEIRQANCVDDGITIPPGNTKALDGIQTICINGKWEVIPTANNNVQITPNDSVSVDNDKPNDSVRSFIPSSFGQIGDSNLQNSNNPTTDNSSPSPASSAQEDRLYAGVGLSLGGYEFVLGTQPNSFVPVVNVFPFRKKDQASDWDGMSTGINISFLGGDVALGKKIGESSYGPSFQMPTLPRTFGGGFTSGVAQCAPLTVFVALPCGIGLGIIGGATDFFTDDELSVSN